MLIACAARYVHIPLRSGDPSIGAERPSISALLQREKRAPVLQGPNSAWRDWSIVSAVVLHQFDIVNGTSLEIITTVDQNLQRRYDELTQKDWGSEDKSFGTVENCFRSDLAAHLMFCHWATEGWRWRALWLETILEGATFKVLVRLYGPDAAYSLSKLEQVVQLQLWKDKVSECVMAMEANVDFITSICRFYNGLLDDKDVPQSLKDAYGLDIVGFTASMEDMNSDLQRQIARTKLLVKITRARKEIFAAGFRHKMARKKHKPDQLNNQTLERPATPVPAQNASPRTQQSNTVYTILRDKRFQRALQLIFLAALYAPVSQLNLSPVYGSVPAGLYHRYGLTASFLLAFVLRGYLPRWIGQAITPFCFWIPTLQFLLFRLSAVLGNPLGPIVTESLTCYPLVALSVYVAMQKFDELFNNQDTSGYGDAVPSMGLFMLFAVLRRACTGFVSSISGPGFLRSRIGLQLLIASLYGMVLPKSLFWPSVPAIAFTMVANPHCTLSRTTQVLNNTLALYEYTLLERKESITGYISVLEDKQRGFRVMRCDHSLLGGEWKMPPLKQGRRKVGEPIYAVFTMLEAVRLVEPSSTQPEKTALNIGLGIGTAPSALIAHGINTTIIEVDPVVHEFAIKYFSLPHNHSYLIGDAVAAVRNANASEANSYDYIIHDVFTGGAEPVELFTAEFFRGLHMLLKQDGVIAINYAGDITMPASSLIYRTITSVFPSCRAFREDEPPEPGTRPDDFTNMVVFCRKDNLPIKFRKPTQPDYLGSGARREYLLPKYEIPSDAFNKNNGILRSGNTKELEKWQAKSALGHWRVMRTVLPDAIWENW
ncbi:hypothetical protein ABEF93_005658 [Exophiala dermatitidis]